jgi:hypothetical protein
MSNAWPDLPKGTLQAGDRIPEAWLSNVDEAGELVLDSDECIEYYELSRKDETLLTRHERRRYRQILDKMNFDPEGSSQD